MPSFLSPYLKIGNYQEIPQKQIILAEDCIYSCQILFLSINVSLCQKFMKVNKIDVDASSVSFQISMYIHIYLNLKCWICRSDKCILASSGFQADIRALQKNLDAKHQVYVLNKNDSFFLLLEGYACGLILSTNKLTYHCLRITCLSLHDVFHYILL